MKFDLAGLYVLAEYAYIYIYIYILLSTGKEVSVCEVD